MAADEGDSAEKFHALARASSASLALVLSSPENLARQAYLAGADAVVALVKRQAEQLEEQARTLDELRKIVDRQKAAKEQMEAMMLKPLIAAHDQLAKERDELAEAHQRVTAERDRLAAELRALRGTRGELPRTAGDLRAWREERGLTQVEAAELLGVGHATVERAEARAADTPLSRVLRLALARDAEATREAARTASPVPRLGPGPKRGTSRRR